MPSPLAADLARALDPMRFAREALGFEPDAWQVALLRSSAPRLLVNTSRQAGKSSVAAILALHVAIYKPGSLTLLLSPTLRQSTELFKKVADFRRRLDWVEVVHDTGTGCQLGNGLRIVALPGSGDNIRGFSSPSLIVEDESAFVPDEVHLACRPMLAASPGGRLILMSTPNGKKGHFFEAWNQGGDDWQRLVVSAAEIPRIAPAFLAAERRALGPSWYEQEYQNRFLEAVGGLFRPADIAAALADLPALDLGLTEPGDVAPLALPRFSPCPS